MAAVGALLVADELARLALDAALKPNLLVTEVAERRARELDVHKAMIRRLLRAVTKIGKCGYMPKLYNLCLSVYTCVYVGTGVHVSVICM